MPIDRPWDSKESPFEYPLPSGEEFLHGQRRRYGQTNPELMRVPFWEYMVRTKREPFFLRETYSYDPEPSSDDFARQQSAIWSFCRIGMTTTHYGDRFRISIGGEHDDWYDPDFLIYNDVVIRDEAGNVWIYGYPKDVFPPTDFHTATLLTSENWKNRIPDDLVDGIIIIGGLGYEEDREFWRTPVFRLDLRELSIRPLNCSGDEPGWIYDHTATLISGARIFVEGGQRLDENGNFAPNQDEFVFDLTSLRWTKRPGVG